MPVLLSFSMEYTTFVIRDSLLLVSGALHFSSTLDRLVSNTQYVGFFSRCGRRSAFSFSRRTVPMLPSVTKTKSLSGSI